MRLPTICSSATLLATAPLVAGMPALALDQPAALVRQWHAVDGTCGDLSKPAATIEAACRQRREVAGRLQRTAWCLGREGELSYRYTWHRCVTGSYNIDGSNYVVRVGALR